MNLKNSLLLVILLIINSVEAQDYRFGKVSKEELKQSFYAPDSSANAVVLYREYLAHYEGGFWVTEIFERVKILNREGYKWTRIENKLYNRNARSEEFIRGLKAYTYNLEGNKIVESKLKKDGIFEVEINKYWKEHKFILPNVKEGSVIEYSYRIESPFMSIEDINLQYDIPILKMAIKLKIPDRYTFNKILNPKATYYPEYTESTAKRQVARTNSQISLPGGGGFVTGTNKKVDYIIVNERVTEINDENVPSLKKEIYVDNINNYRAKLIFEYANAVGKNGDIKVFNNTWEDIVKRIYESSSFGEELEKQNYFKKDIEQLIDGLKDDKVITTKILDFVKRKVKWNGFIGYSTDNGVKTAYKDGTGNIADINLMLTSILRYAGLSANPVLVSTRDNGIPVIATSKGFNYVICRVKLDDNYFLLDATSDYGSANILPERAINWQGRVIDERGFSDWISLKPNIVSDHIFQMSIDIQDDLSVQGKLREKLTNYLALDYRDTYSKIKPESIITQFEKGKGDIVIENLAVKNNTELSKPILLSYDFKLENAIEEIGGKLYFSPLLFFGNNTNTFVQDTRVYPIDLIYPRKTKYRININLPEGYEVDTVPENSKFVLNTSEGEFSYVITPNGKMIQLVVNSDINNTLILPKGYPEFKKFIELSEEKKSEKVVLRKTM